MTASRRLRSQIDNLLSCGRSFGVEAKVVEKGSHVVSQTRTNRIQALFDNRQDNQC